ncbi:MAG: hypothetical protein JXA60_09245 [Candidatus Coatesbacteria bacterium]|nr:hypothetical protein [Candidatus Coatesbacteria bacterium]
MRLCGKFSPELLLFCLFLWFSVSSADDTGGYESSSTGTGTGTSSGTGEPPKTGVYFSFSNNDDTSSLSQNAYYIENLTQNISVSSSNIATARDELNIDEESRRFSTKNDIGYDFMNFAKLSMSYNHSKSQDYESGEERLLTLSDDISAGLLVKPYQDIILSGRYGHSGEKTYSYESSEEKDYGRTGSWAGSYNNDLTRTLKVGLDYSHNFYFRELTESNIHRLSGSIAKRIFEDGVINYGAEQSYSKETNKNSYRDSEEKKYSASFSYKLPYEIKSMLGYNYGVTNDTTSTDSTSSSSFSKGFTQGLAANLSADIFNNLSLTGSLSKTYFKKNYTASINDYYSNSNSLSSQMSYKMPPWGSIDFTRSFKLDQFFLENERNENDRDNYSSTTSLRFDIIPTSFLTLFLTVGGEENAIKYIKSSHSADNKTTTAYQFLPGMTFVPAQKLSVTQTFNIKATYTRYDFQDYAPTDDYLYRQWGVVYYAVYNFTQIWSLSSAYSHNQMDEGVYSYSQSKKKEIFYPSNKRIEDGISLAIQFNPSQKWKNSLGGDLDWTDYYTNVNGEWKESVTGILLQKTLSTSIEYTYSKYSRLKMNASRIFPEDEPAYWQFSLGLSYSPYLQ